MMIYSKHHQKHMKRMPYLLLIALLLLAGTNRGQERTTYRVGLFVPLFLDSAYTPSGEYRYGKGFPKQSLPGLEFYQGAEFALENFMSNEKANVQLHVFDIRSKSLGLSRLVSMPIMDSIDLMIGHVAGNDYLLLAQVAGQKNIPFVSATYPNDGGVKANPNVIMLNAKLNSHLQSLYNHILVNRGTDNILWLRRNNAADDRPADIFRQLNASPEGGGVMKYKTISLPDEFTELDFSGQLDSTRQNLIIAGSLDEAFARKLASGCLKLNKAYPVTIVGMPTWEGISELKKSEYKPLQVIYTTTFHKPALSAWSGRVGDAYKKKSFSNPSDMTFKGYQATYHFVSLLVRYDTALLNNLNEPSLKAQTDYDFRPVRWSKSGALPDYYENKRIYILKRQNGQVSLLN
jgi:hypothetical protein